MADRAASKPNSGFRSNQVMSISEHFELNFRVPITRPGRRLDNSSDYLYQASADVNGVPQGLWGLLRAYRWRGSRPCLFLQQRHPTAVSTSRRSRSRASSTRRRTTLKVRDYRVVAISAADAQGGNANGLVYNNRAGKPLLNDANGLVYVLERDLDRIKNGGAIEPLGPPRQCRRADPGDAHEQAQPRSQHQPVQQCRGHFAPQTVRLDSDPPSTAHDDIEPGRPARGAGELRRQQLERLQRGLQRREQQRPPDGRPGPIGHLRLVCGRLPRRCILAGSFRDRSSTAPSAWRRRIQYSSIRTD